MEKITLKRAENKDMELLVRLRCEVLRAANELPEGRSMKEVERGTRIYLAQHMADDTCVTWLAYAGEELAGCGSISFYEVMPIYHNPSGWKAYIMNMYTRSPYRRKGIARRILKCLVQEAQRKGIEQIALEATRIGRPLYEDFGFRQAEAEMEFVKEKNV